MFTLTTHRPRNVDSSRAAALLYGDWGTSKAYVIGLAFALAGYASFWLILGVSILSLLVGLNYTIICRCYPNGGGVYASVRRRNKTISIIGAFFLVADYLVTAALSALSAFYYFQVANPVVYAAVFIGLIGVLNYFGPRNTGTFASIIAIAAVAVFTLLALSSLPFIGDAVKNLQPLQGDSFSIWAQFCSVIVALSGVETIANTTGVMKLNKGSSNRDPVVTKTSTPAILWVMGEVILYTTLFGLAANAISNFNFSDGTVSAPGFDNARDYMLRYLGVTFGSWLFGAALGKVFGVLISVVVGLILLSAVNTAMGGLISLQYLMAADEELPRNFRKVNRFGVPLIPLLLATVIPMILILSFKNIVYLASLYAIGFVGAIATNLGSTSTDFRLALKKWERVFMFAVFIIMAVIELTLFIDKAHARYFVIGIMGAGIILRWVTKKMQKKEPTPLLPAEPKKEIIRRGAVLCVVKGVNKALREAIGKSNREQSPLNILFIKEQLVISEKDLLKTGEKDAAAKRVFHYAKEKGNPDLIQFHYCVTDSLADIVVAYAMRLESQLIMIDQPKRKLLISTIRENHIRELKQIMPEDIQLQVVGN